MKKAVFLALLSAALTAMAFYVPLLGFLPLFSFAPIIYALQNNIQTKKQAFWISFLFSFIYNLISVAWITKLHPITNFEISYPLSFISVYGAWLFIGVYLGVFGALPLFFTYVINPKEKLYPFLIASLFITAEFLMTFGNLSFPMFRLASAMYEYPIFLKSASLFGSLFISFAMILSSAFLALSFKNKKYIIAPLLIIVLNLALGVAAPDFSGKPITVSMISEGGSHITKKQTSQETYNYLVKETEKTINQNTDIVLWSETSVPENYDINTEYAQNYKNLAKQTEAVIVSGGFKSAGKNKLYSAMLVTEPSGKQSFYAKRRLVPFGEFVPFESILTKIVPSLKNIRTTPYKESCVIKTQKGVIGGIVCYDSVYPQYVRDNALNGAELILLSANESWFLGSKGYLQHYAHSVLRAIENGRFVARTANGGRTSLISPAGNLVASSAERGTVTATAQLIKEKTLYTKTGDIIVIFALLLVLVCVVEKFFKKPVAKKDKRC